MINELCKYLPYDIEMSIEGSNERVKLTYSNIEELVEKGYKPILHPPSFLADDYKAKNKKSILYKFFKEIIEIYPTFSLIDRIEATSFEEDTVLECHYKFCMMGEYSINLHVFNGMIKGVSKVVGCGEVFNFDDGFSLLRKYSVAVNLEIDTYTAK